MADTLKNRRKEEQKLFLNESKKALKELFSKKGYKQIPNLLTASRGIAPIVILPFLITNNLPGAIIAECLFASTDFLDGFIARKFNLGSEYGKKLDTICDKIFAVNLLLPLLLFIPSAGITISLEVIIGAINTISMLKSNNPNSSLLGKFKTASLSLTIILSYISIFTPISSGILNLSIALTTLLQGTTAIDYYLTDKIKDVKKNELEYNYNDNITEKQTPEETTNETTNDVTITYNNEFPLENENKKDKIYTYKK